jgi:phage/plasmid-like protein (TIGR03299 family)
MSALVETAFTVRNPAWWDMDGEHDHDRNPHSVQEALEWAGAEWEPVKTPVFAGKQSLSCDSKSKCGKMAVAQVNDKYNACAKHANEARQSNHKVTALPMKQLPEYYAVTRDDTGAVLNVANSSYEIFTNRETAELVEMLLDDAATSTQTKVQFETGGVLKGGALVWFLARLDEPLEVPGDSSPIYPYVSVLNSHDGTAALRAINTSVRIVCWNTWNAAEREASKSGREFSFRHTGTIRDRIEDARNVLLGARNDTEKWVEYATKMIAIPIEDKQVEEFLELYVPMPPTGAISDRVENNVREARGAIKRFYHSPSCASVAGTAWGLIQATGEYLDHGRNYRTQETYLSRTMLKPEKGKNKALQLVEELVGVSN